MAAARRALAEDRYPLSPRLAPLKSALAKLDPGSVPKAIEPRSPPLSDHPQSIPAARAARGGAE